MNKNAIQKYAIWARNELIEQVKQRAFQYGISDRGYGEENAAVINGRVLTADEKHQRQAFVGQIKERGYQQAVEEVAYTWFNRFVALRFMEVNDYLPTHVRVFSDASGGFNPEILQDVLHLELEGLDKRKVSELLNASKTEELYRYLLLTQCNALNAALPEMFEKLGSYTEMLLPNNILRQDSVLARLVTDIDEDDWKDAVQIIGWMYQYYNTEPKQAVFDGLKKNQKITKEKIPAATQLFTPDWIVRYMVENSLGRLWLESHPNDKLKANWKYYLDEAEQTPEVAEKLRTLRSQSPLKSPEDIRLIDPCMGSGHILVYAFDVLMQIYEGEGYNPRDAVKLILEKNIYGLDIDRRAYQLAWFALMMKARQYDRRILTTGFTPKVYAAVSSQGISRHHIEFMGAGFSPLEVNAAKDSLEYLIDLFTDGEEYGSLLKVERDLDYDFLRRYIMNPKEGQLRLGDDVTVYSTLDLAQNTLLCILDVAQTLAAKYDVVVTNPPYMGSSGMGAKLSEYVKYYYPDSKSDLFSCFIEKGINMLAPCGYNSMVTMQSWLFIVSYEKMRNNILDECHFSSVMHLETMVLGIAFGTAVSILRRQSLNNYNANFFYVRYNDLNENAILNSIPTENIIQKQISDFRKIPGSPIVYWISPRANELFASTSSLAEQYVSGGRNKTHNDDKYLRNIWEIERKDKWCPYIKGGDNRKWFGNEIYVVDWSKPAKNEYKSHGGLVNQQFWGRDGITWSFISYNAKFRYKSIDTIYSSVSPTIFSKDFTYKPATLGYLNSVVGQNMLSITSANLGTNVGEVLKTPAIICENDHVNFLVNKCVEITKADWDIFEISRDFKRHSLICGERTVVGAFDKWKREAAERFDTLKANEEELNRIFIEIYGLQDELMPEVEDKDVTVRRADLGREIRSLISYAVGCMFGRYSLDTQGIVYAGGDWDVRKYSTFMPDKDNILPISDDEYFDDDIVGRFLDFIRVAYGADILEENLKFIANALGGSGTPRKVIRNYFLNGFYTEHCKIYQKRPIYWLFDSGKKNGFKALIYLHRYSRDLLAKLRTDYVHEQQERYRTQLSHIATALNTATGAERAKLLKQQDKLSEQAKEIAVYEEKVHHLADQNINIDLDDGVKKNYEIFADVLAKL